MTRLCHTFQTCHHHKKYHHLQTAMRNSTPIQVGTPTPYAQWHMARQAQCSSSSFPLPLSSALKICWMSPINWTRQKMTTFERLITCMYSFMCLCKLLDWLNALSQTSHLYRFFTCSEIWGQLFSWPHVRKSKFLPMNKLKLSWIETSFTSSAVFRLRSSRDCGLVLTYYMTTCNRVVVAFAAVVVIAVDCCQNFTMFSRWQYLSKSKYPVKYTP